MIACDIAVTETLSRAAESGRHGQDEIEAPEYGLGGVFVTFFFPTMEGPQLLMRATSTPTAPPTSQTLTHTHTRPATFLLPKASLLSRPIV